MSVISAVQTTRVKPGDYITREAAAIQLKCNVRTIDRYIQSKLLKDTRVDKPAGARQAATLILAAEVEAVKRARESGAMRHAVRITPVPPVLAQLPPAPAGAPPAAEEKSDPPSFTPKFTRQQLDDYDPALTLEEAAALKRVTLTWLRRQVELGRLPCINLLEGLSTGAAYRVFWSDLRKMSGHIKETP